MSFAASTASYAQSTASSAQRARPASAASATTQSGAAPMAAPMSSRGSGSSSSRSSSGPSSHSSHSSIGVGGGGGSGGGGGLVSSSSHSQLRPSDRRGGGQFEQRDHALTRVQKLFGLSSLAPGQQYSSTRLAYVPLELLRVTAEEKAALNALQPGKKSYWSTGSGQNHELVFKITVSCLVGFVKLMNRSTSHLEILISMHDVASQYVQIQSDLQCPHNKTVMYPIGFMPARYVKIKCRRGTPISLYNVSVVGVLERVVWRDMGPEMGSLIVEHPEALLLPSKPAQPADSVPTFPSQQVIKATQQQPPIQKCVRQ